MTEAPAIEVHDLVKRFGGRAVVDHVSLTVAKGEIAGFLGPNGSGKTTTIRMLLGLVRPTRGTVEVLGEPIPARTTRVLGRVGALVEGPGFHPYLSGRANLRRLDEVDAAADHRTSTARIDAALERVGLVPAAGKMFRRYSLGMKQRLGIAAALLRDRDLLVLDEPTNGLDPQGTREIRHLIAGLAAEGVTVLVSSHLLSEVEQVCSHIGIMNGGRLVAQGAVEELRAAQQATVVVESPRPDLAAAVLRDRGLADVSHDARRATGLPTAQHQGPDLVAALVHADVPVAGFAVHRPNLEDLFVRLTGEGFEVDR